MPLKSATTARSLPTPSSEPAASTYRRVAHHTNPNQVIIDIANWDGGGAGSGAGTGAGSGAGGTICMVGMVATVATLPTPASESFESRNSERN